MKKKLVYINLFLVQMTLLSFYGCDMFTTKETESVNDDTASAQSEANKALTYELTTYKKQSALCAKENGNCTEVVVQYPFFSNSGAMYINTTIETQLKNTLYSVISEEKSPNISVEKMTELIISDYNDYVEEYDDSTEKWDIDVSVVTTYQKGNLVSLSFSSEYYTGGAHPNSSIEYKILDIKKKQLLGLEDIVSDRKKLTATAEKLFRKQKNLTQNINLQEEGYFFENGKFTINENIGLNQNGLVIYFNSYEIAPYAMGPSAVFIPFYEIKEILKISY
ncbi:MAG: DUF3298 and DUF4163 domain-containing protein [Cyclobacteriaceae bacterium]